MTPADIRTVNSKLKAEFLKGRAPIIELIQAHTQDPFKVLVATILSARTQDATTADACRRLFAAVNTPADLAKRTVGEIEKLIFPVGFYRVKAGHLKQLPGELDQRFGGRVPHTIDELCQLPGVGRKTANLVVSVAFDRPGICVDVHVHRITNRLGLVRTRTPYETEMALRDLLPARYWKTWNRYLVSFGQTVCRPVNPHCPDCPIRRWCDTGRASSERAGK